MASIRLRYTTYGQAMDAIVENHLEGYDVVTGKGTHKYVITKVEELEKVATMDVASLYSAHYDPASAQGSHIREVAASEFSPREQIQMNVNYGALGSAYHRFRPQPARMGDNDAVNHPAYYNDGQTEVWDAISDWNLNFLLGNVVKYVCRAGKKDTTTYLEDLLKAQAYLKREMKRVQDNATD